MEQAEAAARDNATIAHHDRPTLIGSERQVSWAENIRVSLLAALMASRHTSADADCGLCLSVDDAKWRIDHRDLSYAEFLAQATRHLRIAGMPKNRRAV